MRRTLLALQERAMRLWARRIARTFAALALLMLASGLLYSASFGPVDTHAPIEEFVVAPGENVHDVAKALAAAGFVRFSWAFEAAYAGAHRSDMLIRAGGYQIARSMDTVSIANVLGKAPYLVWFTVESGARKEQIAELLEKELAWTPDETAEWLSTSTVPASLPEDGIFFPDVYLIPSDQAPADIRARFQARFSEATAPFMLMALEQGLEWKDVIILASLVEREAGKNDKPLVAGILKNRLMREMPLAVDATLQYIEGESTGGWWAPPDPDTKYEDSPFNTYQNTGLPPSGIAQPSLESIQAVITPQKTSCLYYLHDARGAIHCSPTYTGHKANIARYLR